IFVGDAGAIGLLDLPDAAQVVVETGRGLGTLAGAGQRRGDGCDTVGVVVSVGGCAVSGVRGGRSPPVRIVAEGGLADLRAGRVFARFREQPAILIGLE